jgi:hypothetical protein
LPVSVRTVTVSWLTADLAIVSLLCALCLVSGHGQDRDNSSVSVDNGAG